jgi:hypothetical protein
MAYESKGRQKRFKSKQRRLTLESLEERRLFAMTPAASLAPPLPETGSLAGLIDNWTPLVYAGPDSTVILGETAFLTGEAISNTSQGLTIAWNMVSGPGTVTFSNSNSEITTATFSAAGVYDLQFTVANQFASASDRVRITVNPPASLPGVVLSVSNEMQFTGNNDHVVVPHDNLYLLNDGTIAFWFKVASTPTTIEQGLIAKDSSGFGTGGHFGIEIEKDAKIHAGINSIDATYRLAANSTVSPNRWHHVAISFGSAGLKLYLDGNLEDSNAYTGGLGTSSGGSGNHEPLIIGAAAWGSAPLQGSPVQHPVLGGMIDDVLLVDHALSAQELDALVNGNHSQPVAENAATSISTGLVLTGSVSATDPNGDPLTYSIVSSVSNGILNFNSNGSYTYTPNPSFLGTDTFTFKANDGTSDSNVATVTILVHPPNNEQVLATNNPLSLIEGAAGAITSGLLLTTDTDNTPVQLSYTITAGPTSGTVLRTGSATTSFTQADINAGLITYRHNGSETTSDSFSFTVNDGLGTATSGTFNIVVTPVNDEQSITINNSLSVQLGATATISAAILVASDPDNTPAQLSYTITSGPNSGTLRRSGTVTTTFTQADINAGLVTYQHSGSAATSDSLNFTVNDGQGTSSSGTLNILVYIDAGIPQLPAWEADMLSFGNQHGAWFDANWDTYSIGQVPYASQYYHYDAARVFMQVAAYTGNSQPWHTFAEAAARGWVRYVTEGSGVAGYFAYTDGLIDLFELTGDTAFRNAAIWISDNAAFNKNTLGSVSGAQDVSRSRENAYGLRNELNMEFRLGFARTQWLDLYVTQAKGHLDVWALNPNADSTGAAPFMFGLTAEALVDYYNLVDNTDAEIPAKIKAAADWFWNNMWDANAQAFWYRWNVGQYPAPDLNATVGWVYEWLYQQGYGQTYRDRADAIHIGAVTKAWLGGYPKQFNQSYRYSFDYVAMRRSPPSQLGQPDVTKQAMGPTEGVGVSPFRPTASSGFNNTIDAKAAALAQDETSDLVQSASSFVAMPEVEPASEFRDVDARSLVFWDLAKERENGKYSGLDLMDSLIIEDDIWSWLTG